MEPVPQGARALADQVADETDLTMFDVAGAPLARHAELLGAIAGPAVRDVLAKRVQQMVAHGHTLKGDLDLPTGWLVNDARSRLQSALDCINAPEPRRDLALARRRVVTALALGLAAIDVLDALIAEGGAA